jgi:hypothetical protein
VPGLDITLSAANSPGYDLWRLAAKGHASHRPDGFGDPSSTLTPTPAQLSHLLVVVQPGAPYCGEDGLGIGPVAGGIWVVGAFSLGVDEGLLAANTVSGEFFGDVDVHDVDTSGLGSGDSSLDGGVEGGDCVVDLALQGRGWIPWDNLKTGADSQ